MSTDLIFFPELQLSFTESRILGALLEKEATTPNYYPLTVNSLQTASNQSSNRFPVTELEEETLEDALEEMRSKKLVARMTFSGSRVPKYGHLLSEKLDLNSRQVAVLTTLLLRSVQTAGEIKTRCERMFSFGTVEEVEEVLAWFMEYPHGALVKEIPSGHGRRVKTYAHLLGGEPQLKDGELVAGLAPSAAKLVESDQTTWKSELEERIAVLEAKVAALMGESPVELDAESDSDVVGKNSLSDEDAATAELVVEEG